MTSVITLTNRIDIGNDTDFKCILPNSITIKKNSYVQLQSAYVEKPLSSAESGGVYICCPQLIGESYWLNQDYNAKSGLLGCINNFPGEGTTADDRISFSTSMPKIPLNNEEFSINALDIQLRDRTNAIIAPEFIDIVSVTITITDNINMLS